KQSKVERVLFPGLPDHPQRDILRRQTRCSGGMLSFQLSGGFNSCKKFLKQLRVFTVAESLGGVESLIEHPASMTHASIPRDRRGVSRRVNMGGDIPVDCSSGDSLPSSQSSEPLPQSG